MSAQPQGGARILYLTGPGRCGSTVVERVLHGLPGFHALGEFHCLWRLPDSALCSCGAIRAQDPFWRGVLAKAGISAADLRELARLEHVVARTRFVTRHRFNLASLAADLRVVRYLDLQFRVLDAIAEVTGSTVLVDSSKAAPRAWIMACHPRVHFIHLYRDATAVIASWKGRKFDPSLGGYMRQMPLHRAAAQWLKAELFARALGRGRPIGKLVHQRFCDDPQAQLRAALAQAGIADTPLPDEPQPASEFLPGGEYHSLNGNPDRFDKGPIRITDRHLDLAQFAAVNRLMIPLVGAMLTACLPPER